MLDRRRLIASLFSAVAMLPLASLLPLPVRASATPREGFYMVNGWILTAGDVDALGLGDKAARLA